MNKIVHNIEELINILNETRAKGKRVGFVPTMGYLHEGHLSLLDKCVEENDICVLSIYVNPTQFGPGEDLEKYPRDIDKDKELAFNRGCDIIFAPTDSQMYPKGYNTFVEVGDITKDLCGRQREGHFKGVTTVVLKLFNIVKPDRAYFGQKDYQQYLTVKKMTKDLNLYIEIVKCPIIRENDGLAMSSRNKYLNVAERKSAPVIYRALRIAKEMIMDGEKRPRIIEKLVKNNIQVEKSAKIEYVEIRDANNLKKVNKIDCDIVIAVAVKFGDTRLIDNIIVKGEN